MKRTIFFTVLLVTVSLTASYSRAGSEEKETRNVSDFNSINFGISGDLYINFGKEFKVVLEGDRDVLDDIITDVSGGKLVIKKENWRFRMNERVTVYITMPELRGLGVSGSGRAEIKDALKTDNLNLNVSGSGKIYANEITAGSIDCGISGSGDIIFGDGNASKANISISGSGNYSGESLKLGSADISISGSGNCTCNVTESLHARVSGSGNVGYYGKPEKVDAHVSGSGHVRSR